MKWLSFSWDGELWAERGWFMLLLHHFIKWTRALASSDRPQAMPQSLNCWERWIPDKRRVKRLILKIPKNSEHSKPNPVYGTDIVLPYSVDKGRTWLLVSCICRQPAIFPTLAFLVYITNALSPADTRVSLLLGGLHGQPPGSTISEIPTCFVFFFS